MHRHCMNEIKTKEIVMSSMQDELDTLSWLMWAAVRSARTAKALCAHCICGLGQCEQLEAIDSLVETLKLNEDSFKFSVSISA